MHLFLQGVILCIVGTLCSHSHDPVHDYSKGYWPALVQYRGSATQDSGDLGFVKIVRKNKKGYWRSFSVQILPGAIRIEGTTFKVLHGKFGLRLSSQAIAYGWKRKYQRRASAWCRIHPRSFIGVLPDGSRLYRRENLGKYRKVFRRCSKKDRK